MSIFVAPVKVTMCEVKKGPHKGIKTTEYKENKNSYELRVNGEIKITHRNHCEVVEVE